MTSMPRKFSFERPRGSSLAGRPHHEGKHTRFGAEVCLWAVQFARLQISEARALAWNILCAVMPDENKASRDSRVASDKETLLQASFVACDHKEAIHRMSVALSRLFSFKAAVSCRMQTAAS